MIRSRMIRALAVVAVLAGPASAQESPPLEPVEDVEEPVTDSPVEPVDPAVPLKAKAPPPPNPQAVTLAVFERLPPSAYPEPLIRGIPHGSLWHQKGVLLHLDDGSHLGVLAGTQHTAGIREHAARDDGAGRHVDLPVKGDGSSSRRVHTAVGEDQL